MLKVSLNYHLSLGHALDQTVQAPSFTHISNNDNSLELSESPASPMENVLANHGHECSHHYNHQGDHIRLQVFYWASSQGGSSAQVRLTTFTCSRPPHHICPYQEVSVLQWPANIVKSTTNITCTAMDLDGHICLIPSNRSVLSMPQLASFSFPTLTHPLRSPHDSVLPWSVSR